MSDNRVNLFEPTVRKEATDRFLRSQAPSRWVGVLTPIGGLATSTIRLDLDEVVVGREKGLTASVADASVSRRHACITRRGDEFELEDLGSFNGTHINGVPVRSCVLIDGDTVQFGQTLYLFERILEAGGAARGGQP
jgi:pSer/pThr/pTyr-binding forkhead associated (FHA) protein